MVPGSGWQLHFHILDIFFLPMLLYVVELAASVNEHGSNNSMTLGRHVSCFLASAGSVLYSRVLVLKSHALDYASRTALPS